MTEATASVTGTGLECGLLCRSSSHYRADFSSTGLLRDNVVYLNVKDGVNLIDSVNTAHALVAAGYSTTGATAKANFDNAASNCSDSCSLCRPRRAKDA
jgi:hypothetical protein